MASTCHGGVDPLVGGFDGLVHEGVGEVDEYFIPLATLCFVAGDCIAVVAAEGVEVGVEPQGIGKEFLVFLGDAFCFHADDEIEEEGLLLHLAKVDGG